MGRKVSDIGLDVIVPISLVSFLCTLSDKVAHFVSHLTYHIVKNYPDGEYYFKAPVNSVYLKHHYTSNYKEDVIDILLSADIIEVNGSYSNVLHFPKGYALTKMYRDEIISGEVQKVFIRLPTLINKIKKWKRGTLAINVEKFPFINMEAEMLLNINIDLNKLDSLHQSRLRYIKQSDEKKIGLVIKQAEYSRDKIIQLRNGKEPIDAQIAYSNGRVYHPFVNCPKEYRKVIVDDSNDEFVEVDLRSSQAVFLCKVIAVALSNGLMSVDSNGNYLFNDNLMHEVKSLLTERVKPIKSGFYPIDFVQFWADVFYSDIYNEASPEMLLIIDLNDYRVLQEDGRVKLISNTNIQDNSYFEDRSGTKERFFKDIFFNYFNKDNSVSQEFTSDFLKKFYQRYPTVYAFNKECARQSKEVKRKSRDLALLLQKAESTFFHELVPNYLPSNTQFNYLVVHDAIYSPKDYTYAIYIACRDASKKYFGTVPNFTVSEDIVYPNDAIEELFEDWKSVDKPNSGYKFDTD